MAGMYSTSAERAVQNSTRFRRQDPSSPPPSVEQIAMGLHISRTPYLRSSSTHVAVPLPPPPSRSALKKPEKSSSSPPSLDPPSASSTATSSFPSTPQSNRSLLSFKTRMSRLLPGSQSSSSAPCSMVPSPVSSPRGSTSEFASPKKAVRFSSSALDLNNHKEEEWRPDVFSVHLWCRGCDIYPYYISSLDNWILLKGEDIVNLRFMQDYRTMYSKCYTTHVVS